MSNALDTQFQIAESTADAGSWLANESGNFGMDAQIGNSLKNLLSLSSLSSHCSVITMRIIPSIKFNTFTTVVKALDGGPDKYASELAAIQGGTSSAMTTLASDAKNARDAQAISNISTGYMKSAISAVNDIDKQDNQVLDTNSMMTAFDDYVAKASSGNCGVPINFLLKRITQKQIAKAWVDKYYPNQFRTHDHLGDDVGSSSASSGNASSSDTSGGDTSSSNASSSDASSSDASSGGDSNDNS